LRPVARPQATGRRAQKNEAGKDGGGTAHSIKIPTVFEGRHPFCCMRRCRGSCVLLKLIVGRARCPHRAASVRRCPKRAELGNLPRRAEESAPAPLLIWWSGSSNASFNNSRTPPL
jgi:hypothetical protein